ncbi:MAG: cupredoxin domain-containing protein [Acidimicrobiia bacterium]|jgi:plastocyanin
MRILLVGALALALCACGSDVSEQAAETGGGEPVVIEVTSLAYPDSTVIPAGSSVSFVNDSGFGHTVTFDTRDEEPFELDESLPDGGRLDLDLDPGTYTYFCAIHPTMSGTLVVEG